MHLHIYANLPVNVIVKLPHPRSGDSQGQETFLAPSVGKHTRNYDTECSNHHLPQSILRSKGLSCSKMKWWAVYTNLPVNYIYIFIYIYIYIICIIYILYVLYIYHIYILYIIYQTIYNLVSLLKVCNISGL